MRRSGERRTSTVLLFRKTLVVVDLVVSFVCCWGINTSSTGKAEVEDPPPWLVLVMMMEEVFGGGGGIQLLLEVP
jgi:hypothetical protein